MTFSRILRTALAVLAVAACTVRLTAATSEMADAAMRGDVAAVRALVAQKADVNAPQGDGATALPWAVFPNSVRSGRMVSRYRASSFFGSSSVQ